MFWAILFAFNWPPLKFWEKSSAILGGYSACFTASLLLACPSATDLYSAIYTPWTEISSAKVFLAVFLAQIYVWVTLLLTKLFKNKLASNNWKEVLIFNTINYVGVALVFSVIVVEMRLNL